MLKIKSILLSFFIVIGTLSFSNNANASTNETFFVVTAYYSPLPNQRYYLKGNYKAEIRLNGKGISGASGKKVFPGMLAAPKNYRFGTKIYLEGLGIGSVEDRGGAIVNKGNRGYSYDRIDIWMGHGEEGLKRALAWGKRTIKGSFVNKNVSTTLNLNNIPSPDSALKRLKKQDNIFTKGIGVRSSKKDILALQSFLSDIGLYKGDIDGKYNSKTIDTILSFQKENGLIKSDYQYGAGYWGQTTRKLISKKYSSGGYKKVNNTFDDLFGKNIGPESSKEDIKKVQSIFKDMGLFSGDIDGNYNELEKIIISYQLDNGLINSKLNWGAGYFGPKTRKQSKEDYIVFSKSKKEAEEKEKLYKIEIAKIEKEVEKKVKKHIAKIGSPRYGEIGTHVRELQKTLKVLGYFPVKDSAIFGVITKKSILDYQIDKGIISKSSDKGAGNYGPNTRKQIAIDLAYKLRDLKIKEQKLVSFKN